MTGSPAGLSAPELLAPAGAAGYWVERPTPELRDGLLCKCGEPATDVCSQTIDGFVVTEIDALAAGDRIKDFNQFWVCLSFENRPSIATYGCQWTVESIDEAGPRTRRLVLTMRLRHMAHEYRQERMMFVGEKLARLEPVVCGVGLCDCCGIDPGRRLCWDHAPLREATS